MRKSFKKFLAVATAATMTIGALSLSACTSGFKTPSGGPDKDAKVESNGGFVVSVGDYYYFINGVETYTSDNTYGTPVKGALMRVLKSDVAEGKGDNAQTVIPSLMVAGDYTAGIFVYGGRVYYATPTNVKNTSGVIENTYLDFKSAKLDGSDVQHLFRLASNTTVYRYVEVAGTVYALYVEGSSSYTIHSYDTSKKVDTVLAANATSYLLDSVDKTNANVYYTMGVTIDADSDGAEAQSYNQIYSVNAAATEVPAGYAYGEKNYWDMDWLKENKDGEIPYTNLGTIVLDGVGSMDKASDFNHDLVLDGDGKISNALSPLGYTYTLRTYKDDALYFTRNLTTGAGGDLYYLAENELDADWNTVEGNGDLTRLATSYEASNKATASAYFYSDEEGHHYLYVANSSLYRVDIKDGQEEQEVEIAYDIGTATIVATDSESDDTYKYVYFTRTNSNGLSVERAVYNGEAKHYRTLTEAGADYDAAAYKSVKVLNIQHASGWYNYEIIDGNVFYADAETFGSTSYNYTSVVSLMADNTLMNNRQIKENLNDRYEAITNTTDKTVGLFAKLNDAFGDSDLSNAIRYYFYTGSTEQFHANIDEALNVYNQKKNSLYTEDEVKAFDAFANGEAFRFNEDDENPVFDAADYGNYRTYDDFRTKLGKMNDADAEQYENYWKTSGLAYYNPPAEEDNGLAWWAWLLIAIAIAVVVAAAVLVSLYFYNKKKKDAAAAPVQRRKVDTTDNRDIDVYADEPTEETPAETAEAAPVEEAEAVEEPAEEAPAAEPAAEEAPAEEPANTELTEE